jgi:hypothetical protein
MSEYMSESFRFAFLLCSFGISAKSHAHVNQIIESLIHLLQGSASVVSNAELKTWPQKDWHSSAKPALKSWLASEKTKLDMERLKAVGNIVMPRVAYMAINLIGHDELGLD